ncbi:MAG: Mur ligase family protein, partial [Deltaproteobacteria bacterium]|nr:Mur ligase family protein [Deltaproteobacteria bacterium]
MRTPSIKDTLEYLYSLQSSGIKPGLRRVKALLKALHYPQKNFPSIHIAGTNGKGSTAAMMEAALIKAGFRTGLYTSPHLVRFNERIRISGRPVSDRAVAGAAAAVREALRSLKGEEARPSFFEFTTAMAFLLFRDKKVDIAVIETGMGGRWDATNTVAPLVTVITNIGKEHTEYLGATIAEIASEKAGIIKPGVPAVTAEEKPAALKAIKAAAGKARSPLYILGRDFSVTADEKGPVSYTGMGKSLSGLRLGLLGPFQRRNAACALAALEIIADAGFATPDRAIRAGFGKPDWPGRVEVLSPPGRPLVLLDS